jgi:hypothetical protein
MMKGLALGATLFSLREEKEQIPDGAPSSLSGMTVNTVICNQNNNLTSPPSRTRNE